MTSVAIVGFSGLTLPFVKDSKVDEIWTLNHAYKVIGDTLPRIDRLFEIHEKRWYRRAELASAGEYWEWLKQPHDFPIYMQDVEAEVPASVRYPFDEIVTDLFGKFKRGDEVVKYFTSSFSFLLAMAVYERVERVEIYGIEMLSETEYAYQKPAGEFMIGVALGRGMEIYLPEASHLCRGLLYGYQYIPWADRKTLEAHYDYYEETVVQLGEGKFIAFDNYQKYAGKPDADREKLTKLFNAYRYAMGRHAAYKGAMNNLGKLLQESDYWVSRQKLESRKREARVLLEKWKAEANFTRAQYNTFIAKPDFDQAQSFELWKKHEDAYVNMHGFSGILQSTEKLLSICDMQEVEMELQQKIEDKDT